jgi:3-oxoacyl-[acyl-carrier-protein] synthase-3
MLYLHGIGHFYPENVVSNQFLGDLDIGTTEDTHKWRKKDEI